jgi:hypothetical protein
LGAIKFSAIVQRQYSTGTFTPMHLCIRLGEPQPDLVPRIDLLRIYSRYFPAFCAMVVIVGVFGPFAVLTNSSNFNNRQGALL